MPVDYGAQYLELVGPMNDVLDQARAAEDLGNRKRRWWRPFDSFNSPENQGIRRLPGEVAKSTSACYEGLVAAEWPADVQADVDDLVAQLAAEALAYQAASEAPSFAEMRAAVDGMPNGSNRAGVLRAKLGLGPNATV